MLATGTATTADRRPRGRIISVVAYALVFVAALYMGYARAGGTSAQLCPDHFSDARTVRLCLDGASCNFRGIDSSVPNFINPAGYLHARAGLEFMRVDIDRVHQLMAWGNALAAVIAALWATRLGGPVAGAIAAAIFVGWIIPLSDGIACARSPAPLPLFGAVFLGVYLRALQQPRLALILLAALCGGVMASFYSSTASAIASVALLGFYAPRRRLATAIAAVVVFALFAYVTTPAGWVINVRGLFAERGHGLGIGLGNWGLDGIIVFVATAAVVVTWVRAAQSAPALHRAMVGPLAVMLPPVAVLLGASLIGALAFHQTYIFQSGAAAAVAAALACTAALQARAQNANVPSRHPVLRRRLGWFVVCVIVGRLLMEWAGGSWTLDTLTVDDARKVANVLIERGWTWPKAMRSLQTPERNALRALYELLPQDGDVEDGTGAILLTMPTSSLPEPLPPNWTVANTAWGRATVLVFTRSWLDWRSLRLCVVDATGAEQCQETGKVMSAEGVTANDPVRVAGFPLAMAGPVVVRLYVPITVPSGAGTEQQRIAMRTLSMGCKGRILSIAQPEGGGASVDEDGRGATLVQNGRGAAREAVFEWTLGSPECSNWSLVPRFPPFVLEGDPITVGLIEEILEG